MHVQSENRIIGPPYRPRTGAELGDGQVSGLYISLLRSRFWFDLYHDQSSSLPLFDPYLLPRIMLSFIALAAAGPLALAAAVPRANDGKFDAGRYSLREVGGRNTLVSVLIPGKNL